jgi:very-short-patch-repair endonuclease
MKKPSMFYGAPPHIFDKAKELRNNMTEAEEILWEHLKKKQLGGFKFRRQHPVFEFIADFYCHQAKLVVELDGEYHNSDEQKYSDKERTKMMNEFGINVVRFYNNQVINNTNNVLNTIKNCLNWQDKKSPLGDLGVKT